MIDPHEEITLQQAAKELEVSYQTMLGALKAGCLEGLHGKRKQGHAKGRGRVVTRDSLPAVLDGLWDYVLYHRPTKAAGAASGPWVPADRVAEWLAQQVESQHSNPMVRLAAKLDIDERRLYNWLNCARYISYAMLEDALWAFGLMRPEEICPRAEMRITLPPRRKEP